MLSNAASTSNPPSPRKRPAWCQHEQVGAGDGRCRPHNHRTAGGTRRSYQAFEVARAASCWRSTAFVESRAQANRRPDWRSSCVNSTIGKLIARSHKPTSGAVRLNGVDISYLPERRLRPLRRNVQVVFQGSPFVVESALWPPADRRGAAARIRYQ